MDLVSKIDLAQQYVEGVYDLSVLRDVALSLEGGMTFEAAGDQIFQGLNSTPNSETLLAAAKLGLKTKAHLAPSDTMVRIEALMDGIIASATSHSMSPAFGEIASVESRGGIQRSPTVVLVDPGLADGNRAHVVFSLAAPEAATDRHLFDVDNDGVNELSVPVAEAVVFNLNSSYLDVSSSLFSTDVVGELVGHETGHVHQALFTRTTILRHSADNSDLPFGSEVYETLDRAIERHADAAYAIPYALEKGLPIRTDYYQHVDAEVTGQYNWTDGTQLPYKATLFFELDHVSGHDPQGNPIPRPYSERGDLYIELPPVQREGALIDGLWDPNAGSKLDLSELLADVSGRVPFDLENDLGIGANTYVIAWGSTDSTTDPDGYARSQRILLKAEDVTNNVINQYSVAEIGGIEIGEDAWSVLESQGITVDFLIGNHGLSVDRYGSNIRIETGLGSYIQISDSNANMKADTIIVGKLQSNGQIAVEERGGNREA